MIHFGCTQDEVSGVLASILETHGHGQWKSKLLIRDAIADISLQQVTPFYFSVKIIIFYIGTYVKQGWVGLN